jgi:hypothetical protein
MEKDCSCGVRIRMLKHLSSGRVAPITVEPSRKGNVIVEDGFWRIAREGDEHRVKFLNHFADCPDAKTYGGERTGKPEYRDEAPQGRQSEMFSVPDPNRYTR